MTSIVIDPAENLPGTFILELTRRCNNGCLYCYTAWNAPSLGYAPNRREDEMTLAEIKNMIARLQDEVNLKTIGLSGGEPLLRQDVIPDLIAFIRNQGIAVFLITNGTRLTDEMAKVLAENQAACEITLLSFKKEVHDKLAGRIGARDEAIAGITNARLHGVNPAVVIVATKLNFMDLYRTAELAIGLGASALAYNRLNLGVHNLRFADQLLPTPAMVQENLDILEELGEKYGIPISASVVIEPCIVEIKKYKRINFGWCPLGGAGSYFAIDPRGNLRICNHSPTILGNLRRESFLDIYFNNPYISKFRETWPVECSDCPDEKKNICGGGCKAAAEQCYGTLERVDPFVTLGRKAMDNSIIYPMPASPRREI
jgi:radical SAM protein with 4Fe4S-binding SPASM domain